MNTTLKTLAATALAGLVALGAAGCSQPTAAAPAPSPTATADAKTAPKAADETIKGFFAAVTSDQVAAAFPDKADKHTFDAALKFVEAKPAVAALSGTVTDLVVLKKDAGAPVALAVDESKIAVDGDKAVVPASAVTVTAGGKKVDNSDALAAHFHDLAFRDGNWVLTFPTAPATVAPSASAAASPSATGK